jgi:hypothetical protein
MAVSSGLTACKKKPFTISTDAFILGSKSNIYVVGSGNQSQINPQVLNASVLIATRLKPNEVKFCSGTLIASDQPGGNLRVLANHHCFAAIDDEGIATSVLLPQACVSTKVYLGFSAGQTRSSTVAECLPGSLRTSFEGDLSVFRLASAVPVQFQPLPIVDPNIQVAGRTAMIVHYPDVPEAMVEAPDGGPRLPLAQVTMDNCKVIGNFPIAHWQLDKSLPFSIKHTCDLTHGSSGSGLIDATTGQILGVNWGGIKINSQSGLETVNVATGANFVTAFLNYNTAKLEQSAATELAQASNEQSAKPKSSGVSLNTSGVMPKKSGCGVVASTAEQQAQWPLLAVIALPLMLLIPRLKSRSKWLIGGAALVVVFSPSADALAALKDVNSAERLPTALVSPAIGWGSTYLMNTVFAMEYGNLHDHDGGAAVVTHKERPLHSAEWIRAFFALAELKSSGLQVPGEVELADKVAADPAARANAGVINALRGPLEARLALVEASFKGKDWATRWHTLAAAYRTDVPNCTDSADSLRRLAVTQSQTAEHGPAGAKGRDVGKAAIIPLVKGLDKTQAHCIVAAILRTSTEAQMKLDPLALLTAMSGAGTSLARDPDLMAVHAARLLATHRYAESLALLVELADIDDGYRLPYELIQRAYSWRQRGAGSVAIQSL